jgi:HEPN domain-containing protein
MTQSTIGAVRAWFVKVRQDLEVAEHISDRPGLIEPTLYHCQQAAEKAVKGFLVFHGIKFEKSHDVGRLLRQAATISPGLLSLIVEAEGLTIHATTTRYPLLLVPPAEAADSDMALRHARAIVRNILALLPTDVCPDGLSLSDPSEESGSHSSGSAT